MRVLIAGTHSGCGKTTVTLALMAALRRAGLNVAPFKVGPDYIDTGFHAAACGRHSDNLDMHLCDERTACSILARGEKRADIAVIEGVMGYYDGMDATNMHCSTHEMAQVTHTPTILVVDAAGGAASVAAVVKGFQTLAPESRIAGVLVNRVSSQSHYELVRSAIAHHTGLTCVGYMRKHSAIALSSRHLGLIPAAEQPELAEKVERAAASIQHTVDFNTILTLAQAAPELPEQSAALPRRTSYRLGVARDEAFGFYYEENLRMLCASGMELVFFSPLRDQRIPEQIDGLYIGGGFPEVFAKELTANTSMRASILDALENGMHCYAECGGLIYLSRSIDGQAMVGFFPIACRMTKQLQRFGYVDIADNTGLAFPAHEFHHAVAEPLQHIECAFHISKSSAPDRKWECGYVKHNVLAGFPHLHFGSHPELIGRLWP